MSTDIAFIYEDLARDVFKCNKGGDPWSYAKQETYNHNFIPPNLKCKRALSTILIKLILDNGSESPYLDRLKTLEDSVWEIRTQEDAIKVIEAGVSIVREIDG